MYPQTFRTTLVAAVMMVVGIAQAAELEPANAPEKLCWLAPKNTGAKDRERLAAALAEAMTNTKPSHVEFVLERVTSKTQAVSPACVATLDISKKRDYTRSHELLFSLSKGEAEKPELERAVVLDLKKAESSALVGLWTEIWPLVAPPPPPPPPPPVAETPFVDEELEAAQAKENAPAPEGPPRKAILSAYADLGLLTRSLGADAPGRPVDQSGVLSLGLSGTLHAAEIFRIGERHDIDLDIAYVYRLLRAPEGSGVTVNADRFNLGGAYRFQLPGQNLPRVGALAGYELLRNEVEQGAGALSVRYGVFRLGLSVKQEIPLSEDLGFRAFLDAALRLTPSGEGAETSPGFDIGGGLGFQYERFLVRGRLRYAQQSLEAEGSSFSDGFFDLDLGIGLQL